MGRYATISLWLKRVFFALFAVSFGWVLYNAVFHSRHGRDAALLAFLTLACAAAAVKQPGVTAPWLALFGLLLFLIWWETSSRYTQNFFPFIVLAAVLGAGRLSSFFAPMHKLED